MSAFTGKGLQDVQARYGNRALHDQSESLFIRSVSMRESIVFTITVSAPGGDNPRLLRRFSLLAKIQQCVKNIFFRRNTIFAIKIPGRVEMTQFCNYLDQGHSRLVLLISQNNLWRCRSSGIVTLSWNKKKRTPCN